MIMLSHRLLLGLARPSARALGFSFATTPTTVRTPNLEKDFSEVFAVQKKQQLPTGRAWQAEQLRLKSNEDLHKLWFVCVKEKNLLLADSVIEKKLNGYNSLESRIDKVKKTMGRILTVIQEREQVKREYRKKLEEEYVQKKRRELKEKLSQQDQTIPEITWHMLREKYLELRKGVDNVNYLERIWEKKDDLSQRRQRMIERVKANKSKEFNSFWEYEMTIGERPMQEQVLKAHIKNWRSLNFKQRKIILGFLNAKRSKDAKTSFINQLRILGDKIAQDQAKERIQAGKPQN